MTTSLPVNIDATYADSAADSSVKVHQQHHDVLHNRYNQAIDVKTAGAAGDGTTDDTTAIQAALTAASGGPVYFPPGTYKCGAVTAASAKTKLIFDGATILAPSAISGGIFQVSVADVVARGHLAYNAQTFATPLFSGTSGGDNFDAKDVHASITNANTTPGTANYLFKFVQCNRVQIGGLITTTGNSPWLVYIDRGAGHHVSGVRTPALSVTNGAFAPVQVCESTGAGSLSDVVVTDCVIDGGGVLGGTYPLIMVGTLTTAITSSNIAISNCHVKNSTSLTDGIDVILAQYVEISNCTFVAVNDGINISGSTAVKVSASNASLCHAPGFVVGDATVTANTTDVSFENCSSWACDTTGTGSSQFLVYSPASHTVTDVKFRGCYAAPSGVSQYAAAIAAGGALGSVSGIRYRQCSFYTGTVGYIYDPGGSRNSASYVAQQTDGVNPAGLLNATTQAPAVPSSGTGNVVTNNTGYDCTVFIYSNATGGSTCTAYDGSANALWGIGANATMQIPVRAGGKIALTYTNAPTWQWMAS